MVGLLTRHRRPAVHSRRLYTNTLDPLGRRLGWGVYQGSSRQIIVKAVCRFHLESNRGHASTFDSFRSTGLGCSRDPGCAARKVPACDGLGTIQMVRCFSSEEGVKRPFVLNAGPRMGPRHPLLGRGWRRSCGPTRLGCGCQIVVLMCARDASFGARARNSTRKNRRRWYDSHNAAPIKQQKRSSKATHRGAQGRSMVAGLVSAYRLSFRNGSIPHRVGRWFTKRDRDDRISQ